MGISVDFYSNIISITSPDTEIDLQTLHDYVEDERCMASPVGLGHDPIFVPEGKIEDPVNPGVYSQIILILNSPWQIQFWGGSGYTRVYGGKLVGGLSDEPIKATGTAGDITVLESPVDGITVVSGSAVTEQDKLDIADRVWDEELTGATHNVAQSAGRRLRALGDTVNGSVNDASATTTQFQTNLTTYVDDFFNDQLLRFTSGNLQGMARAILDWTSGGICTIEEPLTAAPDNGSDFDIIPAHIHPVSQIAQGVWDALLADAVGAGSFGEVMALMMGIMGENVKWSNFAHNANHLMTGARITLYTDNTLTTPVASWDIAATYDGDGEMTGYQMVKV